uniref:Acyltransferase n=1 Tax=Saccharum hybrid cultivar R570 TaxID=131158 RepID=A0A0A1I5N4_9POAL|nr:Acyltransferase [Saccharum hybrid cultivar R570]
MAASPFPTVEKCSSTDRAGDTVVADLDGTLLCGRSSFPYFAHMAFETGGVLRLLLLIALAPLAGLLYYFVSEPAGIQVLIFASSRGGQGRRHRGRGAGGAAQVLLRRPAPGVVARVLGVRPPVRAHREPADHGGGVPQGVHRHGRRRRHGARRVARPRHGAGALPRRPGRRAEGGRAPEGVRRRRRARGRPRRQEDGLPVHEAVQGGLRRAGHAQAEARATREPAEASGLPRRPARAEAVPGARAAHRALDPDRVPARVPANRRGRAPADAHGVPRVPRPRRPRHHQGQPSAAGQPRDGPDRRALHLLPPHPPRPHLPLHRPGAPHHRRHLLGTSRGRRGHDPAPPDRGRPGDLPRGDDVPRAVPAPFLGAVRGADGRDRAGGDGEPDEHVPRDDGARVEGAGPLLLLHEPEPRVRGHVPQQAPSRAHLQWRRPEQPRGGQLHPAAHRVHAVLRVHQLHPEGQVQGTRRKRRHRRVQAQH